MMANSTPATPTRHSEMAHFSETLETDPEVQGRGQTGWIQLVGTHKPWTPL